MTAVINALVDLRQAVVQKLALPVLAANNITAGVLRIDKIHATVSGNKWFKLKYALQEAISFGKSTIITFGGAYSNHLVATAYACAQLGLQCVGIVRGEQPAVLSSALKDCMEQGMKLQFVSRDAYSDKQNLYGEIIEQYADAYLVPEGGCSGLGVKGASEILSLAPADEFTHICCAMGTGTMMAGLINAARQDQQVEGFCALKLPNEENELHRFVQQAAAGRNNFSIHYDYHFGGYARKTPQLIDFMNTIYAQTGIELDFVYTAKMLYGVLDLAEKGYFPIESRLLIIHSGGLQGNRSLPKNTLSY
jgi:D-cysteine desulfhydrase